MNKGLAILSLVALLAVSAGCGKQSAQSVTSNGAGGGQAAKPAVAQNGGTYPNAQLLADVKWVSDHMKDANVRIIDARAKGYEQGHIPGAIAVNSNQIKDAANNTIISPDKFTSLFDAAGVNNDTTVVVYDEGNTLSASRLFYGLEYYGLVDHVKVLDGGYAAWSAAGKDVSTDTPTPAKGNFTAKPNPKLITTEDQVKTADKSTCVLLDARTSQEYAGTDLRGNAKGGHIPGAVNRDWSDNVETGADGVPKLKSYQDLKAAFDQIGVVQDKTVIPYCQTNVRGAQVYFTLRLLGYKDIRPYEGSWAQWGNDPSTQVQK